MFEFLRRLTSQRRLRVRDFPCGPAIPTVKIGGNSDPLLDLLAERILMDIIQQESDRQWIDKWNGRTMTTEECKAATGYGPEGNY